MIGMPALIAKAHANGVKCASGGPRTSLDETSSGQFKRTQSHFRNAILNKSKMAAQRKDGKDATLYFPAEPGRYHLYVSYACPWANSVLAMRALKGLEDTIPVHVVHPTWGRTRPETPTDGHMGWVFGDAGYSDGLNGCQSIRDLYETATAVKKGLAPLGTKFTVPVLWCSTEKTIVNNESIEICKMLNSEFDEFAKHSDVDLYPEELMNDIDSVLEWIYDDINNGVYKCGFATSQDAYDANVSNLFNSLERVEDILSRQRYLCGSTMTLADIRLFMTLVRFDEVYVVYFKCTKKCLREYPALFNFVKEMYQNPKIRQDIHLDEIRTHYYTSHEKLNPYAIVPIRPHSDYDAPHDRDSKDYSSDTGTE